MTKNDQTQAKVGGPCHSNPNFYTNLSPGQQLLATENENATFVIVDAEKFPESRKLATVDNLPTFAAFKKGNFVNQVQTNKFEVLKDLVDEVTSN